MWISQGALNAVRGPLVHNSLLQWMSEACMHIYLTKQRDLCSRFLWWLQKEPWEKNESKNARKWTKTKVFNWPHKSSWFGVRSIFRSVNKSKKAFHFIGPTYYQTSLDRPTWATQLCIYSRVALLVPTYCNFWHTILDYCNEKNRELWKELSRTAGAPTMLIFNLVPTFPACSLGNDQSFHTRKCSR